MEQLDPFVKMLSHSKKPSETILGIMEYEDNCRKSFLSYRGFIQHFEHAFELLINLTASINFLNKSPKCFPQHRVLQWILIKNNLSTFYSSFDRLNSGFPIDSLSLNRGLFESVVRIYFISYHPESQESVFGSVPGVQGTGYGFNLSKFIKNELKKDWSKKYFLDSTFAHSNIHQAVQDYIKLNKEEQKDLFVFELGGNQDLNEMGINNLYFLLWNYCAIFKELFIHEDHRLNYEIDSNLYQNLLDTEIALAQILSGVNNPNAKFGFRDRYLDTIDILSTIKILESSRQ